MTADEIKHRIAWLHQIATQDGRVQIGDDTNAEINEIEQLALSAREYVHGEDSNNERLNWLEQHRCTVYNSLEGRHWVVVDETAKSRLGNLGKSLREAIDDARGILSRSE